jgi:hypothetical protein
MTYMQTIQEAQKKADLEKNKGYSKKYVATLREKVHKEQIKDTLVEKKDDMNLMIKEYNMSKNIFDQEEMREKQSS